MKNSKLLPFVLLLSLANSTPVFAGTEERLKAVSQGYSEYLKQTEESESVPTEEERLEEVRRLLPPFLFDKMLVEKDAPPWNSLRTSAKHWLEAEDYVTAYHGAISSAFFRHIARISMREQFYWGYEVRRVKDAMAQCRITIEAGQQILRCMDDKPVHFTGVKHKRLSGLLRADPVDNWDYRPEHVLPNGTRYFTTDEVKVICENPYFEKITPFTEIEPGKFTGTIRFTDSSRVKTAVDEIISRTNRELKTDPDLKSKLHTIAHGIRDLMTTHPLLDGNGRSIRLLGDTWFRRVGLPPPLLMTENELMIALDEYSEFLLRGMEGYLKMKHHEAVPELKDAS